MKKNRMMRLASGLLVAVLATTSMISGTYAKYTTQDSANDVARVAKWGVELQAVGNLYGDSYGANDKIVLDDNDGITVQSVDKATDVVAPGTRNDEGMTFKANGKPEVDYQATVTMEYQNIFLLEEEYGVMVVADGITKENFSEFAEGDANVALYTYATATKTYTKATSYIEGETYYTLEDVLTENEFPADDTNKKYYPVVYNLAGDTKADNNSIEADSIAVVAKAIGESVKKDNSAADAAVIAAGDKTNDWITKATYKSAVYNVNTELKDTLNLETERITWAWDFGTSTGEGDTAAGTDKADTILGNLISEAVAVVVKTGDGTYTTLSKTGDLVFAEGDTDTVYACLETSFSIDITVTQVD